MNYDNITTLLLLLRNTTDHASQLSKDSIEIQYTDIPQIWSDEQWLKHKEKHNWLICRANWGAENVCF